MFKTKEELLAELTAFIGENKTDEAIAILEDVADSVNVPEADPDAPNYEEMYNAAVAEKETLDKTWREKYVARFSEGVEVKEDEEKKEDEEVDLESIQISDII